MSESSYNISYGHIGHDSTKVPFFMQSINNDNSYNTSISILDNIDYNLINDFKNLLLPNDISDFFINNKAFDNEIYINGYTFFSIKKILELSQYYKSNNINNIIDIGFIYKGMGWVSVMYYNTNFNKIFFRHDGGSNNYDRNYNYNLLKKNAGETDINSINSQAYDFKDIIF